MNKNNKKDIISEIYKDDIVSEIYNIFGDDMFKEINEDSLIMKAKNIEAKNIEAYDDKIDFSSITKVHKL